MAGYVRDPVSERFDAGARRLLARLYAARRGDWVSTRVADPGMVMTLSFLAQGIVVDRADPAKAAVGTRLGRWYAGFERALYYQHKWYFTGGRLDTDRRLSPARTGALIVDWGLRLRAAGVIPAGRQVRVRLRPGGEAALRAVRRMGDGERIYDDRGDPAGKWGDPADRDWA